MVICLVFARLALALSAIGIYGVLAYTVTQRTREFGIRMALGASAGDVVGMVMRHGLRLAAIGLGIGVAGALALTRLMTTMLYEVRPTDPLVFGSGGGGADGGGGGGVGGALAADLADTAGQRAALRMTQLAVEPEFGGFGVTDYLYLQVGSGAVLRQEGIDWFEEPVLPAGHGLRDLGLQFQCAVKIQRVGVEIVVACRGARPRREHRR